MTVSLYRAYVTVTVSAPSREAVFKDNKTSASRNGLLNFWNKVRAATASATALLKSEYMRFVSKANGMSLEPSLNRVPLCGCQPGTPVLLIVSTQALMLCVHTSRQMSSSHATKLTTHGISVMGSKMPPQVSKWSSLGIFSKAKP